MPKVSICIPTYRQVNYLKETLGSVLKQTYTNYEVIITDDTEDDSVEKVISSFDFGGKLTYVKNEIILGAPGNWNKAIGLATGEYVKILHHDDRFTFDYSLAKFVEELNNNPQIDFVFSAAIAMNVLKGTKTFFRPSQEKLEELKRDPYSLFFGNIIGPPSSVIFRNKIDLQFDVNTKWVVDICFYIEALLKNRNFGFINEELILSVLDTHNVTNECENNKEVEVFEFVYMYEKTTRNRLITKLKLLGFFLSLYSKYNISDINDLKSVMKGREVPWLLKECLNYRKLQSVIKSRLSF